MAKKKKRGRGRPKGSGGGKSKAAEDAPKSLEEMYELAKHMKTSIAFVTSTIGQVGRKDEPDLKTDLKRMNLANQALAELLKDGRMGRYFFRDYLSAMREAKKKAAAKAKKKGKKGKKGKKKKKKRDDD